MPNRLPRSKFLYIQWVSLPEKCFRIAHKKGKGVKIIPTVPIRSVPDLANRRCVGKGAGIRLIFVSWRMEK